MLYFGLSSKYNFGKKWKKKKEEKKEKEARGTLGRGVIMLLE